jgi:hypothetical protein
MFLNLILRSNYLVEVSFCIEGGLIPGVSSGYCLAIHFVFDITAGTV